MPPVVPEPTTWTLFAAATAFCIWPGSGSPSCRRRRSTSRRRRRRSPSARQRRAQATSQPRARPPHAPTVASGPCGAGNPPRRRRRRRPRRGGRDATGGSSAPSSSCARRSPTRASRRRCCGSATAGSSCSPRSRPDTPVGKFLDRRGPGMHHVAFEVDDVAAELERLAADGAELIDERPRRGVDGPPGRLRPSARHGRRARGAGGPCLSAERVRLEIAFRSGQSLTVNVTPKTADELEARARERRAGRVDVRGRGRPLHGRRADDRLREAPLAREPRRVRRRSGAPLWRSKQGSSACREPARRRSSRALTQAGGGEYGKTNVGMAEVADPRLDALAEGRLGAEGDAGRDPRAGRPRHRARAARQPPAGRRAARRARRLLAGRRPGRRPREPRGSSCSSPTATTSPAGSSASRSRRSRATRSSGPRSSGCARCSRTSTRARRCRSIPGELPEGLEPLTTKPLIAVENGPGGIDLALEAELAELPEEEAAAFRDGGRRRSTRWRAASATRST